MLSLQPPSAVLKCSQILMSIKSKPHQLIANTQMMRGRICYNWLVTCLSGTGFTAYITQGTFQCQTTSFPSQMPDFLIFSLTSPPASVPSHSHPASPSLGAWPSISSRFSPDWALDSGCWLFTFQLPISLLLKGNALGTVTLNTFVILAYHCPWLSCCIYGKSCPVMLTLPT